LETKRKTKVAGFILLLIGLLSERAGAATLTVNTIADDGPGTLRAALENAADGDTIDATGVSGRILLRSGELRIDKNLRVTGPGPVSLVVDGNFSSHVFEVGSEKVVIIVGLGIVGANGSGIWNDHSTLTVSNCVIAGNSADKGGGILNDGSNYGNAVLEVKDSFILHNSAGNLGAGICNDGSYGGSARLLVTGSRIQFGMAHFGGGICNNGVGGSATLIVTNCVLSDNASSGGGGIFNDGSFGDTQIAIFNSLVSSNVAYGPTGGGGIYAFARESGHVDLLISTSTLGQNATYYGGHGGGISARDAAVTVASSTLSNNFADGSGGAIECAGVSSRATFTLSGCTLAANSAAHVGGAIANFAAGADSAVTIANSTLSGNSAGSGGGALCNQGLGFPTSAAARIVNATLIGNCASNNLGGTILNNGSFSGQTMIELGGTILKVGSAGASLANLSGTIVSLGFNLASDDAGAFLNHPADLLNFDPLLGPLQDNGGPTFTHALLCGSPAIDAGKKFAVSSTDQRQAGFNRTVDDPFVPNAADGDGTDIGALEAQTSCLNPEQALAGILELVNSKCDRPQPLRATLEAALASLGRGDYAATVGQLNAFENKVPAQVAPSNPVLAESLVRAAEQVVAGLRAKGY
jgi:hypothetical protein